MNLEGQCQSGFQSSIKNLFFNVEIENDYTTIIKGFRKIKFLKEEPVLKSWSLFYFSLLDTKENTIKKTYNFKFTVSPIEKLKLDFGHIKIGVLESKKKKKLHDISWIISFNEEFKANLYFDNLIRLFTPLSSKYSLKPEINLPDCRIAKFSSMLDEKNLIHGITFILSHNEFNKVYEIQLMIFNDLADL